MKTRIFNLIIVDESGSMNCIYRQALTGMNETLQTIRATAAKFPQQEQYVTLVTFNSTSRPNTNYVLDCIAATQAADIAESQYQPSGCTPLYDAMGTALTRLRAQVAAEDKVLVTIITDGMENSSCEYSGRAIKSLVEDLKSQGWGFTYIGSNHDVAAAAESLSIDAHLEFCEDEEGTREMFQREKRSRANFYRALRENPAASGASLMEGFFEDAKQ